MEFEKPNEISENIYQYFRQILWQFNEKTERLKTVEFSLLDLEHFIENEVFNASTGCLLSKKLKSLRVERRKLKNDIEMLMILKDKHGLDESKLCSHKRTNECVQNKFKQLNELHKNKIYRPRAIKDMIKYIHD